ncbi:DUF853 domain-containing protein [Desulfovibrio sp. OttesenSCG-928-A18]|nr:DUF853 domain-containing protein [Desulfovibrio sp. OttesenSCG-928-A18]
MLDRENRALIAIAGTRELCLNPKMANRHGLITGATGTGKTVTLQTLAETCSAMGVPVFAADIKGDLSGLAAPGGNKESVVKRVEDYGLAAKGFSFRASPVQFWDLFGAEGSPLRARIGDMGPLLLSRLLDLNDTQTAVLTVLFKMCSDRDLELVDLKDLRKLLEYAAAHNNELSAQYGKLSTASIGAIQRGLIALEHEGADLFFGEPALNIDDLLQSEGARGVINILAADKLMRSPKLYSTFLLWLMNALFTQLPEVGDRDKPKLMFFFDEAHLLFSDAPKALVEKVEQIVRLIRSKGVGMFFISQVPSDIPDSVLGQLGNRVQHALRAYTPNDRKALKAAAASFRANPAFDTESAIAALGTGEALVSFLDAKGAPEPVERAFILPPEGQLGPLDAKEREGMFRSTLVYRHYAEAEDRTTAYEILTQKMREVLGDKERAAREKEEAKARKEEEKARALREKNEARERREAEKARLQAEKLARKEAAESRRFWGGMAKSVIAPLAKRVFGSLFRR